MKGSSYVVIGNVRAVTRLAPNRWRLDYVDNGTERSVIADEMMLQRMFEDGDFSPSDGSSRTSRT